MQLCDFNFSFEDNLIFFLVLFSSFQTRYILLISKIFAERPLPLSSKDIPQKRFYSLWATRGLGTLGRRPFFN